MKDRSTLWDASSRQAFCTMQRVNYRLHCISHSHSSQESHREGSLLSLKPKITSQHQAPMISVIRSQYLYMCLSSVVHGFADMPAQKILKCALSQPRNLCFSTLQVRMLPARAYPFTFGQSCTIMVNLPYCAEPCIRQCRMQSCFT